LQKDDAEAKEVKWGVALAEGGRGKRAGWRAWKQVKELKWEVFGQKVEKLRGEGDVAQEQTKGDKLVGHNNLFGAVQGFCRKNWRK
jgi:hypothetical protein